MAKYICNCLDHEEEKSGVGIKIVDGEAIHNIKCPCDQYMNLKDPKIGVPSFKRDRHGRA